MILRSLLSGILNIVVIKTRQKTYLYNSLFYFGWQRPGLELSLFHVISLRVNVLYFSCIYKNMRLIVYLDNTFILPGKKWNYHYLSFTASCWDRNNKYILELICTYWRKNSRFSSIRSTSVFITLFDHGQMVVTKLDTFYKNLKWN